MARKSFIKRPFQNYEMSLQITSMADIFIIILVFLLKSFATGTVNVNPSSGLVLPEAKMSPRDATLDALKVEISETSVQLEGQNISVLKEFQFLKGDLQSTGASQILSQAIEKEREKQLLIAKNNSDVKLDPRIVIVADQRAPYSTLKAVLATAALHGYTDFKLAVVRGGE